MKNSAKCQKTRLPATLASLNNGHNSNLHACCISVKYLSRPLRPCSAAWQSLFIVNLNSIALGRTLVAKVEALIVTGRCYMATTALALNLIWPCNSFMLNHYNSSFLVSPSLALKPVRHRLGLRSSFLGASTRVSTTWLTT